MSLEKNVIITSLDVKRHTVCNQRYIKEYKKSNHQSTNMFELITLFTMAFNGIRQNSQNTDVNIGDVCVSIVLF